MSLKKLIVTSLFSSFVVIFTYIKISIPIGENLSMIHLGNVMCLLSGLILGPFYGGLASGIGSFIFDLLNPQYFFTALISLVFKFLMAFVCGAIFNSKLQKLKLLLATLMGSLVYIFLHELKLFIFNKYFLKFNIELNLFLLGKSLIISIFNAVLSIVFSIIIYKFIHKKIPNLN